MSRLLKSGLWSLAIGSLGAFLTAGGVCGPTYESGLTLLYISASLFVLGAILCVAAIIRAISNGRRRLERLT
jgi:hypothetical protein